MVVALRGFSRDDEHHAHSSPTLPANCRDPSPRSTRLSMTLLGRISAVVTAVTWSYQ